MSLRLTVDIEALKKAVAALQERVGVLEAELAVRPSEPAQNGVHAVPRRRGRPPKAEAA